MTKKVWTQKVKKKLEGYRSQLKGLAFELKIKERFEREGWKCKQRRRRKTHEYDLVCIKKRVFGQDIILVECKNKQRGSANDLLRFNRKFRSFTNRYRNRYDGIGGVFYYTGTPDKTFDEAKRHLERGISVKKIRAS